MQLTELRCKVKRCCNSSVKVSKDKILIIAPNIEIKHTLPFKQLMAIYNDPMKCLQIVIAVGLAYANVAFIESAIEARRSREVSDE